ncbi:Asparagine synthase (Glutamine-hydrolyzing) [Sphingobium herbicidovorans NBRC 16415]|uniref:Asparagine synthase (Glutamine-hydrolyzing) n=1 Tax=Sphingobium herbicidovorans (strain ATCC 700291 / DSM 11019 / CCUG 56400 / KCTC 2939 / LMG 18315 / NBRC 16415 / MH) TaxID=1219045 RepID=A0A086P7S0_SPHHM|nr:MULTISPECIES: asparagine synthetase B family protein [Sphingomonadaceae]KFG89438.1 Asparagine synthase (Glutamine-hydrolyzing) [Sphingobium herbicidovorans NBRC 16415]
MSLRLALIDGAAALGRLPEELLPLATIGPGRLVGDGAAPLTVAGNVALAGWAFHRDGFGPCSDLSDEAAAQIVATRGAWALSVLWGHYLLCWADAAGRVFLLRSPVAGPPVFHARGDEGRSMDGNGNGAASRCAFTDLSLAHSLGFARGGPDPARIDAALRYPFFRGPDTEIAGVREVVPGEIVELASGRRQAGSWSPWDHSVRPPRRAAPDELRRLVGAVTGAWGRRFDRIQLELSGGLDSSIVATCLAESGAQWRGMTLATSDPDGDERPYARAVTDRLCAELAERWRPAPGDPVALPHRLRVRHGGFGLLAPSDAVFLETAREYGADAIFTGAGGDNVFGYITSTAPILDALRFAGPLASWRAAGDLARMAHDNRWKALAYAARRVLKPPPPWPIDTTLLSRRYEGPMPAHPWIADARRAAPGQRVYGTSLFLTQSFVDAYDRALAMPMIAPLLSQPLVEFGLGLASWQWGEGGQDRALARRAFACELPREVLARRSKGRILSIFLPAFAKNRERLRPFLLDGWMAGAGILDLDAVRTMLDGGAGDPVTILRILEVADMEGWARSIVASGVTSDN